MLSAEINHRRDVKEKLHDRCGRFPPSIKTNVEEVIRVVQRLPLPISSIVIEDVQVDIARLNNSELRGSQYQDPTRLDENLRVACLMRDGYQCQQCSKQQQSNKGNNGKTALGLAACEQWSAGGCSRLAPIAELR